MYLIRDLYYSFFRFLFRPTTVIVIMLLWIFHSMTQIIA